MQKSIHFKKIEIDAVAIRRVYTKRSKLGKSPPSVSLPVDVVTELKTIAQRKGVTHPLYALAVGTPDLSVTWPMARRSWAGEWKTAKVK